jgi:hypothetical protein
VTIGAGAYLEPNLSHWHDGKQLTIEGSLTLKADSIYHCHYLAGWTDIVYANGITIEPNAQIELYPRGFRKTTVGAVYTILSNTSDGPINGTFENMPDQQIFFQAGNIMQVSYEGGDGNDLTLTVLKSRDRN